MEDRESVGHRGQHGLITLPVCLPSALVIITHRVFPPRYAATMVLENLSALQIVTCNLASLDVLIIITQSIE